MFGIVAQGSLDCFAFTRKDVRHVERSETSLKLALRHIQEIPQVVQDDVVLS